MKAEEALRAFADRAPGPEGSIGVARSMIRRRKRARAIVLGSGVVVALLALAQGAAWIGAGSQPATAARPAPAHSPTRERVPVLEAPSVQAPAPAPIAIPEPTPSQPAPPRHRAIQREQRPIVAPSTETTRPPIAQSSIELPRCDLGGQARAYRSAMELRGRDDVRVARELRGVREQYPGCPLAQEVDVALVEALLRSHQDRAAQSEAAAFLRRYPNSPRRSDMERIAAGD